MEELRVDQRRQQIVRRRDGVKISGEMQINFFARLDFRKAAPAAPPFIPNTGPSDGSREVITTFLPSSARPWVRLIAVTVLPSPEVVGEVAVTKINFPRG